MGGKPDLVGNVVNRKAKYLDGNGAMDTQTLNKPTSVPLPAPLPVLLGCEFFGFFERGMFETPLRGQCSGVPFECVMRASVHGNGLLRYGSRSGNGDLT